MNAEACDKREDFNLPPFEFAPDQPRNSEQQRPQIILVDLGADAGKEYVDGEDTRRRQED